jgi:DNA (cytosine-5)-methyltransferase 1
VNYLSVCSGIEAATVAWHPLGWEAVAYSEIERFPSEVLAHHYPSTPNLGDMTKFKEWTNVSNVDLLVGGTPCQSFSVAGLRKGLDDPRGNLMLTYLAIARQHRPRWLVWENVPGVLSSNGGLDFASLLRGMGELGYGFAYRILDAQYFGVAQRRRRVFVVGYLGDWRAAAAVLFERHSLSGHPAPSREKGQTIAPSVTTGPPFSRTGNDRVECEAMVVSKCLTARGAGGQNRDSETATLLPIALAENIIGRQPENGGNGDGFTDGGPMYTLNATGVHGVAQPIAFSGQMSNPQTDVDITQTLQAKNPMAVAQPIAFEPGKMKRLGYGDAEAGLAPTLRADAGDNQLAVAQPIGFKETADCLTASYGTKWNGNASADNGSLFVKQAMAVRRLTPVECERLQGFPDNYTDIKSKNKPTPDGPRYKALGNSMAVPVMRWIGERIKAYEFQIER